MTDRKTDTAGAPRAGAPGSGAAGLRPVRRVGSVTLGLCLIAVGLCFLLYYFLPGFNWLLVVKIGAPLALIALGVEVIWCASHQDRWKYDFLAVLGCLVLMGGAFCLTLLPLFWQNVNPSRRIQLDNLGEAYEEKLYTALDGKVELEYLDAYLEARFGVEPPQTLEEIGGAGIRFSLEADLYGPYESAEAFAADCARIMEAVRATGVMPDRVDLEWTRPDNEASMDLTLDTPAKMGWSVDQMAERTRVWAAETYPAVEGSLDEENQEDTSVPEEGSSPSAPDTPSAG